MRNISCVSDQVDSVQLRTNERDRRSFGCRWNKEKAILENENTSLIPIAMEFRSFGTKDGDPDSHSSTVPCFFPFSYSFSYCANVSVTCTRKEKERKTWYVHRIDHGYCLLSPTTFQRWLSSRLSLCHANRVLSSASRLQEKRSKSWAVVSQNRILCAGHWLPNRIDCKWICRARIVIFDRVLTRVFSTSAFISRSTRKDIERDSRTATIDTEK